MTSHVTYCRICSPLCGIVVDVDDGRVTKVTGDADHPLTHGFTCAKGRRLGDFHSDPERLLSSQRRTASGAFEPVSIDDAIDDIGARLLAIVDEHGPDAVALFAGTHTLTASLTHSFMTAWFRAIGSRKRFGTMTLDQSAKTVADGRLGTWAGGRQRFADAEVWMLVGTNPLVSMQGGELTGFPVHDGLRALEAARHRGLKLIVVDPRRTEVAAHADLHLQLKPGTDAALFAGIHRVVLAEGLHDAAFCDRWVEGIDELRAAVDWATPEVVETITDVPADLLVEAARIFGRASSGMVTSGTGPDMAPHANLTEHLLHALNAVCGRHPRAGDRPAGGGALRAEWVFRAQAVPPRRPWERGTAGRLGHGWIGDEMTSPLLPREILEPGPDRVRALVVAGGNPVAVFPDQDRIVEALAALDLLVTIDPYVTETGRLADYVLAPALALERADDTRGYEHLFDEPFAQWTDAVLPKPPGVVEDWEVFLRLADRMALTLVIGDRVYEPGCPVPTATELLEARAAGTRVPYDEVRRHPHGKVFDDVAPTLVGPAQDGADGRLAVMPEDVAAELAAAIVSGIGGARTDRPFLLVVRRAKESFNSLGRRLPDLPRTPYNPLFVHPDDLAALGVDAGALVVVTSDHGSIEAVVEADDTTRPGVVSMTHAYGGLPGVEDAPLQFGANVNRLLSIDVDLQPISLMPRLSAVAVAIVAAGR